MWNDGGFHQNMMGFGDGGWHWLFGPPGLLSIFLIIAVIAAAALLVRDWRHDRSEDRAMDILDARYARGDIDRNEYLAKRKEIAG